MSTLIGSYIRPVASAARFSAAIPAVTGGEVTSGALITTVSGTAAAGERLLHALIGLHHGKVGR